MSCETERELEKLLALDDDHDDDVRLKLLNTKLKFVNEKAIEKMHVKTISKMQKNEII